VTRRSGPPTARPARFGAGSESTRVCALGTRRKRRSTRMKPPISRRPTTGNGVAKASPPGRCRSAHTAPTASTGAGRRADSILSTVATCQWPGGRGRESAPVTRLARLPNRERDRSGAPRRIRISAPRGCRGAAPNIKRRNNRTLARRLLSGRRGPV